MVVRHAVVTGGAGFIGSHLVDRLLGEGWAVTAVDSFDPFYDAVIKRKNIAAHLRHERYALAQVDIRDGEALREALPGPYDVIVHLATRAGVRPSIRDPLGYEEVNVRGTMHMLELARERGVPRFVFASSISVYGVSPDVPWREDAAVVQPISPYAATKVSGELLGHVYSHLYGIRFVALRFFTVYGPRQRPDLAIHKFARLMLDDAPIPFHGDGTSSRDYTYVDDTVQGIRAAMDYTATPYEVINLGNNHTVSLTEIVEALEDVLGVPARVMQLPDQPGDVPRTRADISKARRLLGYAPATPFRAGMTRFGEWVRGGTVRAG